MAEYAAQLPVPTNGLDRSSDVGNSQQGLATGLEIPDQALNIPTGYAASALAYPQQFMPPQAAVQNEQLRQFWQGQMQEIHQVGTDPAEFKNHQLPLARIKKIMKSDEDVRMISAEAPVLFARACEMFILELTLRSWNHSEENKRRTLQRNDIAAAITRTDIFDFLVDIVPREERGDEAGGAPRLPSALSVANPGQPAGVPYWPQQQQQAAPHSAAGPEQVAQVRPQMDPAMAHFYMQQQQQQQEQQQPQPQQQQQEQFPFQPATPMRPGPQQQILEEQGPSSAQNPIDQP